MAASVFIFKREREREKKKEGTVFNEVQLQESVKEGGGEIHGSTQYYLPDYSRPQRLGSK